jgi:hypothetical protein
MGKKENHLSSIPYIKQLEREDSKEGMAPVRDGPCARPRAGEQASARSTLTMIVDSVDVGLKVALA